MEKIEQATMDFEAEKRRQVDAIVTRLLKDHPNTSIWDMPEGKLVNDLWFGTIEIFKVIGHDEETNQVQIKHHSTGGNGSYYVKPYRLLAAYFCNDKPELCWDVLKELHDRGVAV